MTVPAQRFPEFSSPPRVVVIDYGMGNLRSVVNAFRRVGADARLASEPGEAARAEALVFPGQGGIVDCIRRLRETGWDRVICDWIGRDRPFFGICLGMQALFSHSEEGDTLGLDVFPGRVVRFEGGAGRKIPHMGWNAVEFRSSAPLVDNDNLRREFFYFVHSYYVVPNQDSLVWGECEYGVRFCASISTGSCFATQFHPEKSQMAGLLLYRKFLERIPRSSSSQAWTVQT